MARPDLTDATRELYADELAGLKRGLRRGAVVIVSSAGDGERALIDLYNARVEAIEATVFPSRVALRLELLRRGVTQLLGGDPTTLLAAVGPSGDAARQTLAETYGAYATHVMTMMARDTPPPEGLRISLADAVVGVDPTVPIVVFDAHRLDVDARWDVRELERPVVLATRRNQDASLVHADAPFYGHAERIELRQPRPAEWMRALARVGHEIHPRDLEWLLAQSRGRLETTIEALEFKTPERSHRSAWQLAVQRTIPRANELLALAGSVHSDAPALLLALADGQRPYPVAKDLGAGTGRISRAMKKLRELDIVEQPEPRVSRIADPLVEHALRSLSSRGRMLDAFAEVYDSSSPT